MIAIIDYGLGNIKAFVNVYHKFDIPVRIASGISDLESVTKIILPGVGAFDTAISRLNNSGMRERLDKLVIEDRVPVLGICVGMQIMAKSSEEGILPGLGWVDAVVKKFDETKIMAKTHLPHMGWNEVMPVTENHLFDHIEVNSRFYFLHSYYFSCTRPEDEIAISNYGYDFACAIRFKNIYGIQFHPEKSHHSGIMLLKNFATLS